MCASCKFRLPTLSTMPFQRTQCAAHLENLVFAGGSVKGIAYVGAIAVLENANLLKKVKRVGGTSAGAITALLLSLGLDSHRVLALLSDLDVPSFMDDEDSMPKKKLLNFKQSSSSQQSSTASSALIQMGTTLGLYPGVRVRDWFEEQLSGATGLDHCTFAELHDLVTGEHVFELRPRNSLPFRDLYVVGFNLSLGRSVVFSWKTHPDVIIADAVRISMGIPFLFVPSQLYIKDTSTQKRYVQHPKFVGHLWVDGGIVRNYPVDIFDQDTDCKFSTVGFYLTNEEGGQEFETGHQIEPSKIDSLKKYMQKIIQSASYSTQQCDAHISSGDSDRTVYVDNKGISTFAFDLNEKEKNALIRSGWDATKAAFGHVSEKEVCCPSVSVGVCEPVAGVFPGWWWTLFWLSWAGLLGWFGGWWLVGLVVRLAEWRLLGWECLAAVWRLLVSFVSGSCPVVSWLLLGGLILYVSLLSLD